MNEELEAELIDEVLHIDTEVVKCYLCHQSFTQGDKSFLLFSERLQEDGTYDCPLAQILSSALDLDINESTAHSLLLCSDCNDIALDFEQIERTFFQLRTRIITTYETTKQILANLANDNEHEILYANDESSAVEMLESEGEQILGLTVEKDNEVLYEEEALDDTGIDAALIATDDVLVYKVSIDSCETDFNSDMDKQNEVINENSTDAAILNYAESSTPRQRRTHSKERPFVCEICKKAFVTQHNLDAHGITHTNLRPFSCKTCSKAFARKAELIDHERIHTGVRPFKCDFCDASFTQRSNLSAHKKTTHFQEKSHQCDTCQRSFKRRRLLEYHINAAHTGIRPYKCDKCDSSFVYREHYKKHLIIHTGEKPYACEVCGKGFNSRDNRNAHRFVHSDKKPYECVKCGAGFMRKPLLLTHMKNARHNSETIIVNQPQMNGGVLKTATVKMPTDGSATKHEMEEEQLEQLDEEQDESYVLNDEDCMLMNEKSKASKKFKSRAKIDDFVVNWHDITAEKA